MNYFYFVASLPAILPEAAPPMPLEEFLDRCRAQIDEADARSLEHLMDPRASGPAHPFVRRWRDRDTQIRNASAKRRAESLGVDPSPYSKEVEALDAYTETTVSDAFMQANPLLRERMLDRLRWRHIEDLAGLNPFGAEAVFAYALKLKLAERWAGMDKETGRKKLDAMLRPGTERAVPKQPASGPPERKGREKGAR